MPTLVNELTSQQKSWLYETFGHYGEQDELGGQDLESCHYNRSSSRRFSTDTFFRESPTTPYPVPPPPPFPLPPPLFEHEDGLDNRNSIFRRSGANSNGRPSPTSPNERPNHAWSSPVAVDRIIHTPDLTMWGGEDPRIGGGGGMGMIRPPFTRSHTTTILTPRPSPDRGGPDDYHPSTYSPIKPPRSSPTYRDGMRPRSPSSTPIVFPHVEEKLTWQQSFENLKIYKNIYGDCNVPQKYKLNVKLGGWVVRFLPYVCSIICIAFFRVKVSSWNLSFSLLSL